MPLIGITGCTGYYPASVIRQYGMLQDITVKPDLDRTTVDYLDPTQTLPGLRVRLLQIKMLWDTKEIKPVYELDPENKETKMYKATRWYVASQMKRNKDIHYEAPNIFEPVPPEPDPRMIAYMETVSARLEVCYSDFKEREQKLNQELQKAEEEIVTLETKLREANRKIKMLEAQVVCPNKVRRLV